MEQDILILTDFNNYTNPENDTFVVGINDSYRAIFKQTERRILENEIPDFDETNIPAMYQDVLFVSYLKYKLLVEYYRISGINSNLNVSEPTTEVVSYNYTQIATFENIANRYWNRWMKKYNLCKHPRKIIF